MVELTLDQVKQLRTAALDNTARLISDADLLLANARWPGAFESAYFAREEVAKSNTLYAVAHILATGRQVKWKGFWKRWTDHEDKSVGFVMMAKLHEQVLELANAANEDLQYDVAAEAQEAAALREERLAALYVDWAADDGVQIPSVAIKQAQAEEMVAQAKAAPEAANDLDVGLI